MKSGVLVSLHLWRAKNIPDRYFILILAVIIGIAGGLAAALLKNLVALMSRAFSEAYTLFQPDAVLIAAPAVGLLLTALYVTYLNRDKIGRGISNVLYSINQRAGRIPPDKTYSHLITASMTVGLGGSVGLESPIVTTGSAVGSSIAQIFHLSYKRRLLLIGCGAAAATAAIFSAPIAGVVFALEILLLELSVPSFIPLLLASATGAIVGRLLQGYELFINYNLDYILQLREVPLFIGLGIATGLFSILFMRTLYATEKLSLRIRPRLPKAAVAGLLVGLLILVFPPLFGEGYNAMRIILSDQTEALMSANATDLLGSGQWAIMAFVAVLIIAKFLATSLTISGGGNGGVFAPSLFTGALIGFLFARGFNLLGFEFDLPESAFALAGMAGMMTGVMHAPLTGLFLIAEITSGYALIIPLMLVVAVSFVISRVFERHSIYTKQLALKGQIWTHDKDKEVLALMNMKRVIEHDLITIKPEATLRELVEVVKKSTRNIFPVVDDEQNLRGIILLDDIREVMFRTEEYDTLMVSKLMHAPPGHVNLTDNMNAVMKEFKGTGAWNLPVLDEGRYVGFLSKSKIFNIYRTMLVNQQREE